MQATLLNYHFDLIAFAALLTLAIIAAIWTVRHRYTAGTRLAAKVTLAALSLGVISCVMAYSAGEHERTRLVHMVAGVAPTYALELDRAGHRNVTLDTAEDDPTYLALIERQKQWLAANPTVADIYTFRKRDDGTIALCVDSETDYDRSGSIDSDREQRTANNEPYDAEEKILAAFDGTPSFDDSIHTDRWGTWVSANQPLRDEAGNVYAVVGVDFPAQEWLTSILAARRGALLTGGVTVAILLITAVMLAAQHAEVARRRQAEQAHRDSEARLRTIVDNEPECVLVLDVSTFPGNPDACAGRIIEVNPAGLKMLGGDASRVVNRSFIEFVRPDFVAAFRKHQQSVAAGDRAVIEFELHDPATASRRVWMETHSVPLREADGRVVRMLSVARDVTARKLAESEKEDLQRQLIDASRQAGMAEIATGVLHNVGNVLNSINLSGQLIADSLRASKLPSLGKVAELLKSEQPRLGEFVTTDERGKALPDFLSQIHQRLASDQTVITREVTQLLDGIDHVKQIVRMQQTCAAKGSNFLAPADPCAVMEDALRMNLLSMERHKVDVTREYDPALPQVHLDKHKVMQILVNLISNAKQATCHPDVASRHITLRVSRGNDGHCIRFDVHDNGVGMSEEVKSKLFRHGFTTKSDGHGFGLHSSANAARELNGELTAHSDGPGTGATFTLIIPATPTAAQSVALTGRAA